MNLKYRFVVSLVTTTYIKGEPCSLLDFLRQQIRV